MIDLREIRSVTEFQRNIKDYVSRLKKQKTPLVLTVNGRAELVVQDAESYQEILDRLERDFGLLSDARIRVNTPHLLRLLGEADESVLVMT